MADYVGALDSGTTSTRFMIFDRQGRVVAVDAVSFTVPRGEWFEYKFTSVAGADAWRRCIPRRLLVPGLSMIRLRSVTGCSRSLTVRSPKLV